MPLNYRDDLLEYSENKLFRDPFVDSGRMMGHPGFKTANNGKFFLFLYEDGFALKMPPEVYSELLEREDVTHFQPGKDKKPMSTWIVWTLPEPMEYDKDWEKIVGAARDYTAKEPPNEKKPRR